MRNYGKFVKGCLFFLFIPFFGLTPNSFAAVINETIYPSGIVINEILPSPEGPDEKEEWIEIFNQNGFEVVLSGWQIKDLKGKIKTYTFQHKTTIPQKGFLVLPRLETKITLNNNGDGLSIIQPNGKIIDSVSYENAPQGQSYNRINSEWVWSATLTPGSVNIIPPPSSEIKKTETPKEEITKPKREIAAIGEQIPKSFLPFLVALAIAISSGGIILLLKKKIENF